MGRPVVDTVGRPLDATAASSQGERPDAVHSKVRAGLSFNGACDKRILHSALQDDIHQIDRAQREDRTRSQQPELGDELGTEGW